MGIQETVEFFAKEGRVILQAPVAFCVALLILVDRILTLGALV